MGGSPVILSLSRERSLPHLLPEDLHTTRHGETMILGASFALFIRHY